MLPELNRLKKRKDFKNLFKKGKGFKQGFLFLKFVENNLGVSRFGFVASRNFSKKAVLRNKIKRRLRAIIREMLPEIKNGIDGILAVYSGLEKKSFSEIKEAIRTVFQKAKILKNNN